VKHALQRSDAGREQASQSGKDDSVDNSECDEPDLLRGMRVQSSGMEQDDRRCGEHRISQNDGEHTAQDLHDLQIIRTLSVFPPAGRRNRYNPSEP